MKNILLPFLGVILFISVVGYFSKNVSKYSVPTLTEQRTIDVSIREVSITAEIAGSAVKREKGLSGREGLCSSCGMLFDFTNSSNKRPSFWMKDMNFPIDIIWIDSSKRIIGIEESVPAPLPDTSDASLKLYTPSGPIEYVLEVNAGFTEMHEIKVGDEVNFSL